MLNKLAELANNALQTKLKQSHLTHDDTMAILDLVTAYERLSKKKVTSAVETEEETEDIVNGIHETQEKLSGDLSEALNIDALYEAVENPKEVGES